MAFPVEKSETCRVEIRQTIRTREISLKSYLSGEASLDMFRIWYR